MDRDLCRPMVVLAGSSDQPQESMGAFQEFPQVRDLSDRIDLFNLIP